MIRSENGRLATFVYIDVRDRDIASVVSDLQRSVAAADLPEGVTAAYSGQFEYLARAAQRLAVQREWLSLVKNSFLSQIMTPVTSYLVVENEAQKAILKKKQAQVLANNKSLDLGEEAQRMTEPGLYLLVIMLALFIWYREKRKKSYIP